MGILLKGLMNTVVREFYRRRDFKLRKKIEAWDLWQQGWV